MSASSLPPPPKQQTRWLLWVYLGFGLISCIGFIVVAVKIQNPRYTKAAVIAFTVCAVSWAAYLMWPPEDTVTADTSSTVTPGVGAYNGLAIVMAIWLGLIIYGHVLNRDYKEFLLAEADRRWRRTAAYIPTFQPQTAPPRMAAPQYTSPPGPTNSQPTGGHVEDLPRLEADRYHAFQPPGNAPAVVPPNRPQT